jgi:hypothetical protein
MTNQQLNDMSHKVMAAVMLRKFAAETLTSQKMHSARASEAEAIANRIMEV